ncbi:hypothetical protein llap_13129 [Limosa lapponica baueri]|uniref:Uncharacterized protein n=1 Tax=Limosa lapponica baueri TaxID=1758121 RepID=A0A2I0TS05_LIMLA|nr:hypothetical protein llap_13129 [Limosa lapponica baueri]
MVEEGETGADEAVIALAASMQPSGADKKTIGIGERGPTDFSGSWINNYKFKGKRSSALSVNALIVLDHLKSQSIP